jgi:hypothetical protein
MGRSDRSLSILTLVKMTIHSVRLGKRKIGSCGKQLQGPFPYVVPKRSTQCGEEM